MSNDLFYTLHWNLCSLWIRHLSTYGYIVMQSVYRLVILSLLYHKTYSFPSLLSLQSTLLGRLQSECITITTIHTVTVQNLGTAVAQWLRCCATNWKVAGSILAGVSGFFIDIKSFWSHYGRGVDSASNRNEYQEHFLGVKAAGA